MPLPARLAAAARRALSGLATNRLVAPAGFGLAAALALVAAAGLARLVEGRAERALRLALDAAGAGWVEVAADGLQVALSGTAASEAERVRALEIAGRVVDSVRVIDRMEVAARPAAAPPDHVLEILRNEEGIALIGLVPEAMGGGWFARHLSALDPDAVVSDMTETTPHPAPPGWEEAVGFALSILADLPRSKISVGGTQIAVTAVAGSPAEKRRLEADFAARAPEGLRLTLDISAPRPVIAPFTLRFVIDAEGARFDACAADSEAAAERIRAAAVAAGALGRTACTIGLGVPTPAWGEATAAGIAALAELGEGTITFSDADVTLIVPHTVSPELFDEVAGALKRRLPPVFSLRSERLAPPAGAEAAEAPEVLAVLAPDGGVEIRGRLADERMRDVVDGFARARFGADAVTILARLEPGLPDGWTVRVLAGLDALGELAEGRVRIRPGVVELSGVTGNPEATALLSRALAERLGPGADFRLALRYDARFDPAAGRPSPEECLARIAAIQAERKITFAPGSAEIAPAAAATLDAIAEVLRGCGEPPLEIAGFTDSQGREEMNLRLSQSRAEAVLAALLARRVPVAGMVAKGYGAAEPIADNRTEAGREANRRIEFRLRPEAVAAAAAEEEGEARAAAPDPAQDAASAERAAGEGSAAAAAPQAAPGPEPGEAGGPAAEGEEPARTTVETPGPDTPRPKPRPARD